MIGKLPLCSAGLRDRSAGPGGMDVDSAELVVTRLGEGGSDKASAEQQAGGEDAGHGDLRSLVMNLVAAVGCRGEAIQNSGPVGPALQATWGGARGGGRSRGAGPGDSVADRIAKAKAGPKAGGLRPGPCEARPVACN